MGRGMGLNIKNEHVHDLAKRAALMTGTSQTSAIETALKRYLEELGGPDRQAERRTRVDLVLADFDVRLDAAARADFTTDDLYDESGLPA